MTYESPSAFRQALLRRLNAEAVNRGIAAERLHVDVVFKRLLARLMEVAPDRWVLKGGLAEKVHAYTRTFASGPGSRVKDLIDVVLIATIQEGIGAGRLARSLRETFTRLGTHDLPLVLPAPPSDWLRAYREMGERVDLDQRMDAGFALARLLIDPLLAGAVAEDAEWIPDERVWRLKG